MQSSVTITRVTGPDPQGVSAYDLWWSDEYGEITSLVRCTEQQLAQHVAEIERPRVAEPGPDSRQPWTDRAVAAALVALSILVVYEALVWVAP